MIHKEHIENFLRVNKIPTTTPDHKIRELLLYSHWNEDDVETALLLLRGGELETPQQPTSPSYILQSTDTLSPDAISSLLGIDVVVEHRNFAEKRRERKDVGKLLYMTTFFVASTLLASVFAFFLVLFFLKLGPFYAPL